MCSSDSAAILILPHLSYLGAKSEFPANAAPLDSFPDSTSPTATRVRAPDESGNESTCALMASRLLRRGPSRAVCTRLWGGSGGDVFRSATRAQPFTSRSVSSFLSRPVVGAAELEPRTHHKSPVCNWYLSIGRQCAWLSNGAQRGEGDDRREEAEVKARALMQKGNVEKVKVIIKEYGSVAVVFHTAISLVSLGTCYLLVSK